MRLIPILAVFLLLAGCGSSRPIPTGNNTYMISRSSAAGAFANMEEIKREVIEEANEFARKQGKIAVRTDSSETFPTHGFPSYEYNFRLEDAPKPTDDKPQP